MEDLARVATVTVSKKKALIKSGARKGKLRKGCHFRGGKVYCTPAAAARLGSGKGSKRKGGRKGKMPNIRPKTPQAQLNYNVFQALMGARKLFKRAPNCDIKVHAGRKIIQALNFMSRLPVKPTKKNPHAQSSIRNARYFKERDRVAMETQASCGGGASSARPASASSAAYEAHMVAMRRKYGPSHVSGMSRR